MNLAELSFLSIVQGITEFLPISSSAHLILGRELMQALGVASSQMTPMEELAFDIALHIGTLGAVVIYFWREMLMFVRGALELVTGRMGEAGRLLLLTIAASVPIVIIGFLAKDFITDQARSTVVIGWTSVLFGLLLWAADRRGQVKGALGELTLRDGVLIGFAQCLAIIPGVSRSGICMTAGRFLGLDRTLSARFAMLLSIPTIMGAGVLATVDLVKAGDATVTTDALIGGAMAFVSALVAISLMMGWLRTRSYTPFVIYRVVLGVALLALVMG